MEKSKTTQVIRALLPWAISLTLLSWVLYSHGGELGQVYGELLKARLFYFFFWTVVFVIFWLLTYALFVYFCLRWFIAIPPRPNSVAPPSDINFDFRGIARACAASYLLFLLNLFVAFGGLVVYLHLRWGVPYRRGSAVMLANLLNSLAALSLLAFIGVRMIPPHLVSVHAQDQLELAGIAGLSGMGFYLACFAAARLWNYLPESMHRDETVFSPFVLCPLHAWPVLLGIQLLQMASYGLFVILVMPAFDLHPPAAAAMGLTQVVVLTRGLPISALGIGLDQLTFTYLFQGFGQARVLLAFSFAYTFFQIGVRFLIALPFFTSATREFFEPEDSKAADH